MNKLTHRRFEELKAGGLLPSPSGVALAVLELIARPNATAKEITRQIQVDPAMTGRILRYANMAHRGAQRRIVSLAQAVTFLGVFRLRQIALGFSLIDQYRTGSCSAFDYDGYWTTSLATGIAAQKLSSWAQSPPDESFSCGLLAQIGRLGLVTAFPQEYASIVAQGLAGAALAAEENRRFAIDHTHLSAEMLASWGLPEIFSIAVRDHEHPAQAESTPGSRANTLCTALHLALRIGQLLNLDETERWEKVPALFNAAAQLGIEEDAVPPLLDKIVADWQDWAEELKLPTRTYSDLRTLLAAPPADLGGIVGSTLAFAPLDVALLIDDPARQRDLRGVLTALGLNVVLVGSAGDIHGDGRFDLAIIDTGGANTNALAQMNELRQAAGRALHIIALIPADAESRVAQLMLAGASDYLLYDFTEAALIARLSNAQRLVSLQGTVRAERELAVSSSGEWARASRRLLHDALTDPLTELPNRRYGLDRLAQEWSVAASNSLPLACLMLDIDHFKAVNDKRGHDVGDVVLQQVAAAVESSCRRSDIVFRYGGEEFCGICPATALPEALQLAERIAAAVRGRRYGLRSDMFPLTLSIGVAIRTPAMADPGELIVVADGALYEAKLTGRNKVLAAKQ